MYEELDSQESTILSENHQLPRIHPSDAKLLITSQTNPEIHQKQTFPRHGVANQVLTESNGSDLGRHQPDSMSPNLTKLQKPTNGEDSNAESDEESVWDRELLEKSFIYKLIRWVRSYGWYLIGGVYGFLLAMIILSLILSKTVWSTTVFYSIPLSTWMGFFLLSLASLPCLFLLIRILLGVFESFYITRNYLWHHLRQLVPMLSISCWLLLVLILWFSLIGSISFYVGATIGAMLAVAICFLIKQFVLNLASLHFEKIAFLERIQDALFAEFVVWSMLHQQGGYEFRTSKPKHYPLAKFPFLLKDLFHNDTWNSNQKSSTFSCVSLFSDIDDELFFMPSDEIST